MALLTLKEASEQVGLTRPAVFKAIKSGKLSATKDSHGRFQIDPAELFRVYPPIKKDETQVEPSFKMETDGLRREIDQRDLRINDLRSQIDDLRADRDHWRQQATALLTHQPDSAPEVGADAERAGFRLPPWVWLFVGAGLVAVTGAAFAWRHPEFFA